MPAFVAILLSVFSSLIVKVLAAFGIGIISYTGMQFVLTNLKDVIHSTFSGMPSDLYNILLISGVGVALGYIFGAYAFMVTYQLLNKLAVGASK